MFAFESGALTPKFVDATDPYKSLRFEIDKVGELAFDDRNLLGRCVALSAEALDLGADLADLLGQLSATALDAGAPARNQRLLACHDRCNLGIIAMIEDSRRPFDINRSGRLGFESRLDAAELIELATYDLQSRTDNRIVEIEKKHARFYEITVLDGYRFDDAAFGMLNPLGAGLNDNRAGRDDGPADPGYRCPAAESDNQYCDRRKAKQRVGPEGSVQRPCKRFILHL